MPDSAPPRRPPKLLPGTSLLVFPRRDGLPEDFSPYWPHGLDFSDQAHPADDGRTTARRTDMQPLSGRNPDTSMQRAAPVAANYSRASDDWLQQTTPAATDSRGPIAMRAREARPTSATLANAEQPSPPPGDAVRSSGWNSGPWTPPPDGEFIKTQSVFGEVHLRHRDLAPTEKVDFTPLHQEVLRNAESYKPDSGVHEWNSLDAAQYLGGKDIFPFKDQWVKGYRKAIVAAAAKWNLPPALLAGVVYNEVGGDPAWADDAAFEQRKLIPVPRPADKTSFGDVSIQLRRAAQTLGYGDNPTPAQIAAVRASLKNPVQNIFIVAKHLSDLRDVDFRGVSASQLTPEQIEVIGARYNRGPDIPLAAIKQHLSYGKSIEKRWQHLNDLIGN